MEGHRLAEGDGVIYRRRILVGERLVEYRIGMLVDTGSSSNDDASSIASGSHVEGSERVIHAAPRRALPKLEDYVKKLDAEPKPKHNGGKTTAKKERRKIKKRFKDFVRRRSNKIAPMELPCSEGRMEIGRENQQNESVASVEEDITSPKTLYTRRVSDESVREDTVSIVGDAAEYQHRHRKEFFYNLFGECFGLFRLNKVDQREQMFICGTKAHIEKCEENPLSPQASDISITTVKRSVPYINLHDTRSSPLRQLGSDSSVSSGSNESPKPGPSSPVPRKPKKPAMTKKDAKLFWERIKKMEVLKSKNKLPPLKKGTRYFEVENEASRPCTPNPRLASRMASRSAKRSSKAVDISTKVNEANERRDCALREKSDAQRRSNQPRTNTVQLRMTEKQQNMREKLLEKERRLQETKASEKSERERKKLEEEIRREEVKRQVANQQREKTEHKRMRMLEREAESDGRRSAMLASRCEKRRETKERRERIKINKEAQDRARVEKFKQKQAEREAMADGRRSSMLASRQEKLRKHHNRVDVIQKKFTRPAHIRAIDLPVEPTEYPEDSTIESGPRPTSPDEYRWTPTPPPTTTRRLIIDTSDEEDPEERKGTPGPVLIDGEDPCDFFLQDLGERQPGDGEQEEDLRKEADGEAGDDGGKDAADAEVASGIGGYCAGDYAEGEEEAGLLGEGNLAGEHNGSAGGNDGVGAVATEDGMAKEQGVIGGSGAIAGGSGGGENVY